MVKKNGIFLTVIVTLCLAALTVSVGFAAFNNRKIQTHELKYGHLGMDERVDGIEKTLVVMGATQAEFRTETKADLKDIKADIRAILIRLGGGVSE